MTHISRDHEAAPEDARTDEELLAAVRAGDTGAYALLYRRHQGAALAVARRLSGTHEGQDVVQEAFLKVLRAITRGAGPREGFAPYLMRSVRNEAVDRRRRSRELTVAEIETVEPAPVEDVEQFDSEAVRRAFSALPAHWQRILWLTEVDGLAPREVAPQLQRSANAVAQLSRRAREGLRSAWLQTHVDGAAVEAGCRQTASELGAYERGQLSASRTQQVASHLEGCSNCAAMLRDLQSLTTRMRAVLLPVVLASPELLSELTRPAPAAGQNDQLPEPTELDADAAAAARPQRRGRAALVGFSVPAVAAGVALLVGAAGLVVSAQRPGGERDVLPYSLDSDDAGGIGAAPAEPEETQAAAEPGETSRAQEPVDPVTPTLLPTTSQEPQENADASDEQAVSGTAVTPAGGHPAQASPSVSGPMTSPSPAPGDTPSPDPEPADQATPPVEAPATTVPPAPPTVPSEPADLTTPVEPPPSDPVDDSDEKPDAPSVPDPPFLGETPPVFAPDPPQETEAPAPPPDEPTEETGSGDGSGATAPGGGG